MNTIREIQKLNQRELENVTPPSASWHTDYRDTAYVHIGGLSFDLTEGDITTIFSQYGEPVWLKLARDKETGKSRGFAWLKYEDQRSCDLAVDNLGGAEVLGRTLKVDHTRYKKRDDEEDDDNQYIIRFEGADESGRSPKRRRGSESDSEGERPLLKEEMELAELIRNHDDDDPMKAYLIQEKKDEVTEALAKQQGSKPKSEKSHRRHRHHSRRIKDGEDTDKRSDRHRHRHRDKGDGSHRDRPRDHGKERARDGDRDHHRSERRHEGHSRREDERSVHRDHERDHKERRRRDS